MVTGAKPTPRMVPELLIEHPMQEPLQHPESTHSECQESTKSVQGPTLTNATTDFNPNPYGLPIQFNYTDVWWETGQFQFCWRSHSYYDKNAAWSDWINENQSFLVTSTQKRNRNINSTNWQTLEEILTVFRMKYVRPKSQATAEENATD